MHCDKLGPALCCFTGHHGTHFSLCLATGFPESTLSVLMHWDSENMGTFWEDSSAPVCTSLDHWWWVQDSRNTVDVTPQHCVDWLPDRVSLQAGATAGSSYQ